MTTTFSVIFVATKAKNTLLLKVDGQDVPHGEGKAGSSSADTKNPLYIGGVPGMLKNKHKAVLYKQIGY